MLSTVGGASVEAVRQFFRKNGFTESAALGFYSLLAFIPLIFLAISAAGVVVGETQAVRDFLAEQLEQILPWYKDQIMSRMSDLVRISSKLGIQSIVFMIWTSGLFFYQLQQGLLLHWDMPPPTHARKWFRYLFPWLAGPLFGVLMLLLMAAAQVLSYLPHNLLPESVAQVLVIPPMAWSTLGLTLIFFLIYATMLPTSGRLKAMLWVGAVLSVASHVITLFLSRLLTATPNYNAFYGSLAGTVVFLLWLEYNMLLIVLGGHFVRVWPDYTRRSVPWPRQTQAQQPPAP